MTQSGLLVGTPGYMAPEQAGGSGRRALVGPATDIYALGVILYQLLTGQLPFQGDSTLEVLRAVTSDEPVRPRRLQPRLPRDLEAITLHCLEKEPRRRYPSALALAEDLQRFREGKPVAARPVGSGARLARACRRRPLVALLLGLLTASLFGGLAGVTWKWLEANDQRDLADARARQADDEKQAALYQAYRARLAAAGAAMQNHDVADAARQLDGRPGGPTRLGMAALAQPARRLLDGDPVPHWGERNPDPRPGPTPGRDVHERWPAPHGPGRRRASESANSHPISARRDRCGDAPGTTGCCVARRGLRVVR